MKVLCRPTCSTRPTGAVAVATLCPVDKKPRYRRPKRGGTRYTFTCFSISAKTLRGGVAGGFLPLSPSTFSTTSRQKPVRSRRLVSFTRYKGRGVGLVFLPVSRVTSTRLFGVTGWEANFGQTVARCTRVGTTGVATSSAAPFQTVRGVI